MTPFATPLRAFRGMKFGEIERYWSDREYRKRCEDERAHEQRLLDARIDAGMAELNERQREAWEQDNG